MSQCAVERKRRILCNIIHNCHVNMLPVRCRCFSVGWPLYTALPLTNAGPLPCQAAGVIQRHWVEAELAADGDEDAATSDQVPQSVSRVVVIHRTTGGGLKPIDRRIHCTRAACMAWGGFRVACGVMQTAFRSCVQLFLGSSCLCCPLPSPMHAPPPLPGSQPLFNTPIYPFTGEDGILVAFNHQGDKCPIVSTFIGSAVDIGG